MLEQFSRTELIIGKEGLEKKSILEKEKQDESEKESPDKEELEKVKLDEGEPSDIIDIIENGKELAKLSRYQIENQIEVFDIDIESLTNERISNKTFSDSKKN